MTPITPAFAETDIDALKDIEGRIAVLRTRALPDAPSTLYATCDVAWTRACMGEDLTKTRSAPERQQWIEHINSFARPDGTYENPNHGEHHRNGMVIGALAVLGGKQKYPVSLYDEFDELDEIEPWLERIEWDRQWGASHLFWGGMHCFSSSSRCSDPWRDRMFRWLDENLDEQTGWWRKGVPQADRHIEVLGGAAHIWPVYQQHGHPFPYPEKVIDSILGMQQSDGSWLGFSNYMELDALYGLALMRTLAPGYRKEDILGAARRHGRLVQHRYAHFMATRPDTHTLLAVVGTLALLQELDSERFIDDIRWSDIFSDQKFYATNLVESKNTPPAYPVSAEDRRFALWDGSGDRPVPASRDCLPLADVEFSVIKAREPEKDGYNWLHGLAICWHKNALYATFGHNQGSENTATEVANGRKSIDGGKTWGPLFAIDDGDTTNPAVSHGVLLSHAGELWALQGCFSNRMRDVHTQAFVLDDSTDTWRGRGVVAEHGFWPMQEPVKLGDGNWMMAGISVTDGLGGTNDPSAVAISHGDDLTQWSVVRIPKPTDLTMWGESTVIVDGQRILNIARWGRPIALAALSTDFGRSWSKLQESNLPMAGSKPYAGVLSTGQRYLICTTTSDAGNRRSPLTIAVSRPDEDLFSRVYRIRDAVHDGPGECRPDCRLSYPYAVERDGRLYVAYSNDGGRGANRNSAELAIIPVASLR